MKGRHVLAMVFVTCLWAGCASPAKPKVREDFLTLYTVQAYDRCLVEIGRALNTRINKEQRARLLMTRALCEDEMGRNDAAKADYLQVTTEFRLTRYADFAQRRLEGKDGDQRARLDLKLPETEWRRTAIKVNGKGVRRYYNRTVEYPEHFTEKLMLLSVDQPVDVKTIDDATARADAEFELRGGRVVHHPIERTADEEYSEGEVRSPNGKGRDVSLSRVILRNGRLHVAMFVIRRATLSDQERDKYLAYLKAAEIVGDH